MGLFGKSEPEEPKSGNRPSKFFNAKRDFAYLRQPERSSARKRSLPASSIRARLVQIEGRVEGKIKSSGLVVIGEAGSSESADRSGQRLHPRNTGRRLHGEEQKSRSPAPARFFGNLRAPRIAVAEGAIFRGASQMTANEERSGAKEAPAPTAPGSQAGSAPGSSEKTGGG